MNSVSIFTPGVAIVTSIVSASAAIPLTSGLLPRYVRIASTTAAYVRLGPATPTAVAGDMLIQPGDQIVVSVAGCTNVAAIQVTAAGIVQVSPVDNM